MSKINQSRSMKTKASESLRKELLKKYTEACNYPGLLNKTAVEKSLREYLDALGVKRKIQRIEQGWTLAEYPSLERYTRAVIKKMYPIDARDATAAIDARDARAAIDATAATDATAAREATDAIDATAAIDARDATAARAATAARDATAARAARDAIAARAALKRFAQWCIQSTGWWYWRFELSWVAVTYNGAVEREDKAVQKWSRPLYQAFLDGAWMLHWTEDVLYWVSKPKVHVDRSNGRRQLHNEKYAALESDVENLYFWHGVLVPAFVVVKPEWITVKHIETETNAEVRRVMIERYGQAKYLIDSGAKELHRDDWGILYRKEIPNDEPLVMVKVVNSTPEPDGHFKDYFLRVQPELRPMLKHGLGDHPQKQTALNAVASTFGMTGDQYKKALVFQS